MANAGNRVGWKAFDGSTTSGRYSKRLRKDLAQRIEDFNEATESTEEEENFLRWMMSEYLGSFSEGSITIDQLYPNWLVGLKTLSEAIERRVKAQYMKQRLVTPEQMMIIFRLIGDILETRISDQREKQLAAQDIAALIAGQSSIEIRAYKHVNLPETNAVAIIDSAIPV